MTSQRHVVERSWRKNLLYTVLLELTYRCNLDCYFCYNDVGLAGEPLSTEEYERLLEDLAAMQAMEVTLSGGEPLAHPAFFHLGARARQLGFVVRIKSNGHALRGPLAKRIQEEIDPFLIEVSLHGATAAVHDRQTRIPGSFDQLMVNLGEMRKLGLRLKLNSTLTAWNEAEIGDMFDLAEERELPLAMHPNVTPRDDGDTQPLSIAPSDDAIRTLYRERLHRAPDPLPRSPLPAATAPIQKNCGAGSSTVTVDPYGNVYPCVQWRRSIGNLHEKNIVEIWSGSAELDEIRQLTVEAKTTRDAQGEISRSLSFCPGLSEQTTGDALGVEPEAVRQAELLEEVRRQAGDSPLKVLN